MFPKWKNRISIVIEGSVAGGTYDAHSDIDLHLVVPARLKKTYSLDEVKAYKKHLRVLGEPVQIHAPTSYDEVQAKLEDWTADYALRESVRALIVVDPEDAFKRIQKFFQWYPKLIFKEKLNWLFAEAIFRYEDRFKVASKRSDLFFGEVNKLEIMRLLLNAYLLANKQFPAFDKHLMNDISRLSPVPTKLLGQSQRLLQAQDLRDMDRLLVELFETVESYCVEKRLMKQRSRQEWIDLRPSYQVKFE